MKTATLGRAGVYVSRAGLGLAAPGRPEYLNLGHADVRDGAVAATRARAHAVLDAARI